ncbi:MAG: hypothetical protein LBK41_06120 [Clostridiales bacterium]|jgi:hypothetical protein|nr:hypothetical protein [Clostridiales bacterium]
MELGIAVHFKPPEDSEPGVFRFNYRLGDHDENISGLLKRLEMGAAYCNRCITNGNYDNVNAFFGGKTVDDAIRLASDYTKTYETLRDSMFEIKEKTVDKQTAADAKLEVDVKTDKAASIRDSAKSARAEQKRPPARKSRPDFLAKIKTNKHRVVQENRSAAKKNKKRSDDRTV